MALASDLNRVRYEGDGEQVSFDYPFKIYDEAHLTVIISDAEDTPGSRDTLELDTDYSVFGVGDEDGGSIVLEEELADGWFVTIVRVVPLLQTSEYDDQTGFSLVQLTKDLDLAVMMIQQLQEQVDRSLKSSISSDNAEGTAIVAVLEGYIATAQSAANAASASASTASTDAENASASASQASLYLAAANIPSSLAGQNGKALVVKTDQSGYELVDLATKEETLKNKRIEAPQLMGNLDFNTASSIAGFVPSFLIAPVGSETPGVDKMYGEAVVKAWAIIDEKGSVLASYNVAAAANDTGSCIVTFKRPFASSNYVVTCNTLGSLNGRVQPSTLATNYVGFYCVNHYDGTPLHRTFMFIAMGDQ